MQEYLDLCNGLRDALLNDPSSVPAFQSGSSMPFALQQSFESMAQRDGQLEVYGYRPGEIPTDIQNEHLKQVCRLTALAFVRAVEGMVQEESDKSNGGPYKDYVLNTGNDEPDDKSAENAMIDKILRAGSQLQLGFTQHSLSKKLWYCYL